MLELEYTARQYRSRKPPGRRPHPTAQWHMSIPLHGFMMSFCVISVRLEAAKRPAHTIAKRSLPLGNRAQALQRSTLKLRATTVQILSTTSSVSIWIRQENRRALYATDLMC